MSSNASPAQITEQDRHDARAFGQSVQEDSPGGQLCVQAKTRMAQLPLIQHLLKSINHHVTTPYSLEALVQCRQCSPHSTAALLFEHEPNAIRAKVVLCEAAIDTAAGDLSVTHELVHLYDHVRLDPDHPTFPFFTLPSQKHLTRAQSLACLEIRAAALSGQCSLERKLTHPKLNNRGTFKQCIVDHAIHSVSLIYGDGTVPVTEVFDQCIADTSPFGVYPD